MCADDNELKFVETSSVAFFRTTVAPDYLLTPQVLCGVVYCLVDGYINGIYFSTPFHLLYFATQVIHIIDNLGHVY